MKLTEKIFVGFVFVLMIAGYLIAEGGTGTTTTSNVKMDSKTISALNNMSVKNLKVVEVASSGTNKRCFNLAGDISQPLICFDTRVKDACIMKQVVTQKSRIIRGMISTLNITKNVCTGEYTYRDMTNAEVNQVVDNALRDYLSKLTKEEQPTKPTIYGDRVVSIK